MTDRKRLGRGLSSVPHYTVECADCGQFTTWATSGRINAFWARIRTFGTIEDVLVRLRCQSCGGRPNRIEFDYSPATMGVGAEVGKGQKAGD